MKLIQWLKSLFTRGKTTMTETITTEQPAVDDPAVSVTPTTEATAEPEALVEDATNDVEKFESKVKELVVEFGDKAHLVIDEILSAAKKLI